MILWWLGCSPLPSTSTDSGSGDDDDGPAPIEFRVIGFNTESGGSVPDEVAGTIVDVTGEALWGFAEVQDENAARVYVEAADDGGETWDYEYGSTGYSDRLVLAWNDDVFSLESFEELHDINVGGTARSPLVGQMRHRESGIEFLFVVNHLWRTEEASRHEQARLLNDWGSAQDLPLVLVGDYNFDWDVQTGVHDEGYDELVDGGVFDWVEPEVVMSTQCSRVYDSVLDFVFVGDDARSWDATSKILKDDATYCTSSFEDTLSDHRPVRADFSVPAPQ